MSLTTPLFSPKSFAALEGVGVTDVKLAWDEASPKYIVYWTFGGERIRRSYGPELTQRVVRSMYAHLWNFALYELVLAKDRRADGKIAHEVDRTGYIRVEALRATGSPSTL